ncbi:uncharacterized protein BDZ83DRAFT_1264 [Colletotrichum acutatum]|uniref:Uncharacterized protein n=1 Tax=Glomerella acutata TaxID=27357 RepID=A0AAD8XQL2_GLOAC|nr:uncharacterized protein BDZ83DRAFT_1264 [Colletotrichum acutatum]KAK1731700.1 hypothetical protein BDZ83DRAFT_1264 [Colletotrichum acutatum]
MQHSVYLAHSMIMRFIGGDSDRCGPFALLFFCSSTLLCPLLLRTPCSLYNFGIYAHIMTLCSLMNFFLQHRENRFTVHDYQRHVTIGCFPTE